MRPTPCRPASLTDGPTPGRDEGDDLPIVGMGGYANANVLSARRRQGSVVRQLVGARPQALQHAAHLALRPLELLLAHLPEGAAELIVEADEAFDAGDAGLGDAAVDLVGEVDDLIGLAHHVFHGRGA